MAKPDYTINSVTISPTSPVAGNVLSFTAVVKNSGGASTGSSFTKLRIDTNSDGKWDMLPADAFTDTIASGGSVKAGWSSIWKAASGKHTYEVCADTTSLISEADETNNCLRGTFAVLTSALRVPFSQWMASLVRTLFGF